MPPSDGHIICHKRHACFLVLTKEVPISSNSSFLLILVLPMELLRNRSTTLFISVTNLVSHLIILAVSLDNSSSVLIMSIPIFFYLDPGFIIFMGIAGFCFFFLEEIRFEMPTTTQPPLRPKELRHLSRVIF